MAKKDKPKKDGKAEKAKTPPASGVLQSDITRAARGMRTFLTNSLAQSGLYAGQDGVIQALAGTDGMTAGAIAARLGVKPPTMTRTLSRMEAQGFIRRSGAEGDGRQSLAILTEEGKRHLDAIAYAVKATEGYAFAGLSEKELRQFAKVLKKVNRNLDTSSGAEEEDAGE